MKVLAWLLSVCILLPVTASCGGTTKDNTADTNENTKETVTTSEDTEPPDSLDARKLVDDGLGEYDFGGYV